MSPTKLTPLDVFKLTNQSNCGECDLPNCMAFAARVTQGIKDPRDCPHLEAEVIEKILRSADVEEDVPVEENRPESLLSELFDQIGDIDFPEAAQRLGGWMSGSRLGIRCLGKIFELDNKGGLHSLCHVNPWIHVSILQYVIHGEGLDPVGEWTIFREMKKAQDWERFFAHRCERAFLQIADQHTDLFLDILELFGKSIHVPGVEAEYSILLHPLPKAPFLFCYSPSDGRFESNFNLFFDKTIEANLRAEGTYLLAQGLVEMIKRLIARHEH